MKHLIPDTIFARLFLLMFVTLSLSFFVGRELFTELVYNTSPMRSGIHPHQFNLKNLLFRMTGIGSAAWIAARWLSKPIQRMAHAAYQLGENLNRPPLDETTGPAEVRQASIVFNQMQVRLNQQIAERSCFLAAVSHDLRTPLTRLKLRAEKMADQQLKSQIKDDVDEMAFMIDAALDYLRGTGQPESASLLDITALVNSLVEDAQDRGETVTVSGHSALIRVQPTAVRRCMNNLIENAIRYGGQAEVAIQETIDNVIISIRDTGPGIPDEKLEAVFAPFFRLEESRNRNTGGIGLGLSIARDIARQQGGDVKLRNSHEGGLIATLILLK